MDQQRQGGRSRGTGCQGMHPGRPTPVHIAPSGDGKEDGRPSGGTYGGGCEKAVSGFEWVQLRQRVSFPGEPCLIERAIGAGGIAEEGQTIATGTGGGANRRVHRSPTRALGG